MNDLRFAFRQLAKNPAFILIAVLALALGIGANTAIFSVVNAVLLRPLPYPEPEKLIVLRETTDAFTWGSVSYPNYLDWREAQRGFTDLALIRRDAFNLSTAGGETEPAQVGGSRATANYLSIMQVLPRLGRDLTERDDQPGSGKVILISERLWQERFGGSLNAIGQKLIVDTVPREIVGVFPSALRYPRSAEIILPLAELRAAENVLQRDNHPGFTAIGRLKPGVTLQQANADMENIARELERKYPQSNTNRRIRMQPLLEAAVGDYRHSLNLLLAAVGCVLLIACTNVANLQLARALARSKELAVRAALGASRWRLARQLLTESSVLAFIGAVFGVILAIWSLDAILALSPPKVPRFQETRIDLRALFFTASIALGSGLLVGIWPAWQISRTASLTNALHEVGMRGGSGGIRRHRARAMLLVIQVALAVILLAGAGLTLKSFWRAQGEPLGFEPRGILTMLISLPKARYDKREKIAAFHVQLLDRIRSLPGVAGAAIGANVPFDNTEWDSSFYLTGVPKPQPGKEPSAEVNFVSPDYFRVLGMPILRGRGFGPEDVAGRPRSVIIDESFARRYFPNVDPIGQHLDDNQSMDKNAPPLTVVGIVPRTRNEAPGEENVERLHLPQMHFCAHHRSRSAGRCSLDYGKEHRREPGSASIDDDLARRVRGRRSRPRQRRFVWRDGSERHGAHTRARHSHGAGRGTPGRFPPRPWTGHDLGFSGDWPGIDWCDRCKPCVKQPALRHRCTRCFRTCHRNCFARIGRAARVLAARSPRHAGRSHSSIAHRMKSAIS